MCLCVKKMLFFEREMKSYITSSSSSLSTTTTITIILSKCIYILFMKKRKNVCCDANFCVFVKIYICSCISEHDDNLSCVCLNIFFARKPWDIIRRARMIQPRLWAVFWAPLHPHEHVECVYPGPIGSHNTVHIAYTQACVDTSFHGPRPGGCAQSLDCVLCNRIDHKEPLSRGGTVPCGFSMSLDSNPAQLDTSHMETRAVPSVLFDCALLHYKSSDSTTRIAGTGI